jgi:zinc protease
MKPRTNSEIRTLSEAWRSHNTERRTSGGSGFSALCSAFCILCSAFCIRGEVSAVPLYRDTLPNGLAVISYVDHRLPMADIAFVCRSGSANDPEARWGLANGTANLLTRGSKTMTADSIASIVEFLGAQFNGSADNDNSVISLRVLTKDLTTGLDLLTDAVRNPSFDVKETERARAEGLAGIREMSDYPMARVRTEFYNTLLAGHPYGHQTIGDTVSLMTIKREDLIAFHKDHYVPNNCFIVAVGDFERPELLKMIQARFGDMTRGTVPEVKVPEVPFPGKLRVKLINRPEMNQTYVMFGHPGIARSDPDWLATMLAAHVLGGSALASRIGNAVREEAGLAYEVRTVFDQNRLRGTFWAWVQTAKPKEAIAIMFREIEKMQKDGAKQNELDDAQNYYAGSYPIRFSSNQGKLSEAINIEINQLGLDWVDKYPGKVRAVTLDDVNRAARERLHPGQYVMIVMGNVKKEDLGLSDVEWIE